MLDVNELVCHYFYKRTEDCSTFFITYKGELFLANITTDYIPNMSHYSIHVLSDNFDKYKLAPIAGGLVREHLSEETVEKEIKSICLEIEDFYA